MNTPSRRCRGSTALRLTITGRAGLTHAPHLRRHLRAAHALLNTRLSELSVALVGDATMSKLHQRYLCLAGPTDVLTFALDTDSRGRAVSGEVVICVPEARRRSRRNGIALRDELLLYALHGMLHLSGFDDRTRKQFDRMHRTEDRILTLLGIGPVFQAEAHQ